MLENEIDKLKKQIEPRENEVKKMKEQVHVVRSEDLHPVHYVPYISLI